MPGLSPEALALVLAVAISWFVGEEAWQGLKWVGHEAKQAGTAIVHVLSHIPHPHHEGS